MTDDTERARAEIVKHLRLKFGGMSGEEKKALNERLWNMIQYGIGRHDYWDAYRTRYLTIATALLAVAAAVIGILANTKSLNIPIALLYAAFMSLGVTGIVLIVRFRLETSPEYPYRSKAKIKSWIHLYTVAERRALLRGLRDPAVAEDEAKAYVQRLEAFTREWSELAEAERWQEDLEQVFILFLLQAYKRAFSKRMASILESGLIVTGVFLFLALGMGVVLLVTGSGG